MMDELEVRQKFCFRSVEKKKKEELYFEPGDVSVITHKLFS